MTACHCSKNHDSSGFVSGFAVGLVLGAAGAHYLNSTKQGQELLHTLKEKANETLETIKDNPAIADKIADLQKTMDEARATINHAAEKVASATEPTSPTLSSPERGGPKKNFFQKMGASLGR